MGGQHGLRTGHPDWKSLLCQAINDAYSSSDDEDRVGVFVCGSPAFERELQRAEREINADHQCEHNDTCSCRIMVYKAKL